MVLITELDMGEAYTRKAGEASNPITNYLILIRRIPKQRRSSLVGNVNKSTVIYITTLDQSKAALN